MHAKKSPARDQKERPISVNSPTGAGGRLGVNRAALNYRLRKIRNHAAAATIVVTALRPCDVRRGLKRAVDGIGNCTRICWPTG